MERRAKCRICDEVIDFTDVGSLGHHLITKHPSCSPNYFSVSERNVKNGSLNRSVSKKSSQKIQNKECTALVQSLSKILGLLDNKSETKYYSEKNKCYYESNYNILNAKCTPCCQPNPSCCEIKKKKCSKTKTPKEKKKCSKTSCTKDKRAKTCCETRDHSNVCDHLDKNCTSPIYCCDERNGRTIVESRESLCVLDDAGRSIKDSCERPCKPCRKVFKTTVTSWKSGSKLHYCTNCKAYVTPIIKKTRNRMTRHSVLSAFLLGCWPICFLCPMQFTRESAYYCCKCRRLIEVEGKKC